MKWIWLGGQARRNKETKMRKLYKFCWDCDRMGVVKGHFVADEQEVALAIGKEVYFGEILGKHSEIYGTLDKDDIEEITDDQDFIDKAIEYNIDQFGYNPLSYLKEE